MSYRRVDRHQDICKLSSGANSTLNSHGKFTSFLKSMSDDDIYALEQAIGNISLELGQPSEDLIELIREAIINNWSSKELAQYIQDVNRA